MKKQANKLTLNKKTISNLNSSEMNRLIGGRTYLSGNGCGCYPGGPTRHCSQNQKTCPGHNTCYDC